MICIGTAGWVLPRDARGAFPTAISNLASYAQAFNGVEINSTFRKSHRKATYARWADSVPDAFRFSVKVPKDISQVRALVDAHGAIRQFIAGKISARPKDSDAWCIFDNTASGAATANALAMPRRIST